MTNKYKKILALLLVLLVCLSCCVVVASADEGQTTIYEAEDATTNYKAQIFNWETWQNEESDPVESNANASGGKNIGYFNAIGNSITWTIPSDSAQTINLSIVAASCINAMEMDQTTYQLTSLVNMDFDMASHWSLTVNGTPVDLTGKVVAGAGDVLATHGAQYG